MRPQELLERLAGEEKFSDTDSNSSRSSSKRMQIPASSDNGGLLSRLTSRPFGTQSGHNEACYDATAGQYWVHTKDGESWPVVICDEEMASNFIAPRPKYARRPDGTWHATVLPGGVHTGAKTYPCVYVGTLERAWIPIQKLEPFEVTAALQKQHNPSSVNLARAWREAKERHEKSGGIDDLGYWKDQILARELHQEYSKDCRGRTSPVLGPMFRKSAQKRKRKPSLDSREDVQDDEEPELFLNTKIKKEGGEADEYDLFADPFIRQSSSKPSKRGNLSISRQPTPRLGTPFTYKSASVSAPFDRRKSMCRSPAPSLLHKAEDDPDSVKIYVSDVAIRINRSKLTLSPKLQSLLLRDSQSGWFVMSPVLYSLTKEQFEPIAHFLQRQEYSPNLLDDGTDYARLERTFTSKGRGQEIERSGMIHALAKQFEIEGLQKLSFKKLKTLAISSEAFPIVSILNVIHDVYNVASPDLQDFLVQYLAQRFWDFVDFETQKTKRIMQSMYKVAEGVYAALARCAPLESAREKGNSLSDSEDSIMDNLSKEKKDEEEARSTEAEEAELQEKKNEIIQSAIDKATEEDKMQKSDADEIANAMKKSTADQGDNFLDEYI